MSSKLSSFASRLTRAIPRPRQSRLATSSSALGLTRIDNPTSPFLTAASNPRIHQQPALPGARNMTTTSDSSADAATVSGILRPGVLQEVWDFWFSHITEIDNAVLPKLEQSQRWFSGDEELDRGCNQRFRPTLEALQSLNPSPKSLVEALEGAPAKSWAAVVILLDQVPRNCFRGSESSVVFRFFDPLALAVTERAIELGIPTSPDFKYYLSRRMWFYLPLMHSEELSKHDLALAQYQQMGEEVRALLAAPDSAESEHDRTCGEILARSKDATVTMLDMNQDFEKRHRDIIVKFGRYPHRNAPLGRAMTPAEMEFLDSGGDTFGAKKG